MSYPGLKYPTDKTYLTNLKDQGYFILVDRNAQNVSLIPGGEINDLLASNNNLIFIFDVHLAGTRQDLIDALYLAGYDVDDITTIILSGININNINTPQAQQWIEIFHNQNIQNQIQQPSSNDNYQNIQTKEPSIITNNVQNNIRQRVPAPTQGELPPNLSYPVTSSYTPGYIDYLRQSIHDAITENYLGGNPNFNVIPDILEQMYTIYDQMFFDSQLSGITTKNNVNLTLQFSDKLTKTGGSCDKKRCVYIIKISQPIILDTFKHGESFHISNGLKCYDRLECLMNVFEHELMHFVVGITHGHVSKDPIYKAHGLYFQQLVRSYFGHTKFHHELIHTGRNTEITGKKEDFSEHDYVTYRSKKGFLVTGQILKLNPKRAVVDNMTVPYSMLQHATDSERQIYLNSRNTQQIPNSPTRKPTLTLSDLMPWDEPKTNEIVDPGAVDVIPYNPNPILNQVINTQPQQHPVRKVGDIVTFSTKTGPITDRIVRVNDKTLSIGQYRVGKGLIRDPTNEELNKFLTKPATANRTRSDFYIGQHVSSVPDRKGTVIHGVIEKLNPSRAVVNGYSIPYHMLV
jgi:hypothetical protein